MYLFGKRVLKGELSARYLKNQPSYCDNLSFYIIKNKKYEIGFPPFLLLNL